MHACQLDIQMYVRLHQVCTSDSMHSMYSTLLMVADPL
jgi:hypothetical protein